MYSLEPSFAPKPLTESCQIKILFEMRPKGTQIVQNNPEIKYKTFQVCLVNFVDPEQVTT